MRGNTHELPPVRDGGSEEPRERKLAREPSTAITLQMRICAASVYLSRVWRVKGGPLEARSSFFQRRRRAFVQRRRIHWKARCRDRSFLKVRSMFIGLLYKI